MAIQFLNNVDFNLNQAQGFVLENLSTDPASGQTNGRLIYNTNSNVVKVFNGTAWVEVGGGVTDLTVSGGTYISLTDASAATGSVDLGTVDLSATGTPGSTNFLRGDNAWATPDYYTDSDVDTHLNVSSATANQILEWTGADYAWVTPTDENDFLTGLSFNTNTGVLTATVSNQSDVTVDLDGRYLTGNQTITLTGEVTGTGTTSIATTVADGVLDVANFNATAIVTEAEGIENNDNDTTLPTSAAVKDYVDSAVVGGLVYQGGYNASTNTPNLDNNPSPNNIEKGWTYTVTADGSFFTEQVRVGDVLIAEVDAPTSLADWTTVQNNIDLASLTQVGIGNVNAGTGIGVSYTSGTATVSNTGVTSLAAGEGINVSGSTGAITVSAEDSSATNKGIVIVSPGEAIDVSYSSGTATVSVEDSTASNKGAVIVSGGTGISVTYSNGTATVSQDGTNQSAKRINLNNTVNGVTRAEAGGITTFTIDVSDANIFGGTTSALDIMVEVIGNAANAGDTVYTETGRSASNLTLKFTGSVANGDYQVLLNNVA